MDVWELVFNRAKALAVFEEIGSRNSSMCLCIMFSLRCIFVRIVRRIILSIYLSIDDASSCLRSRTELLRGSSSPSFFYFFLDDLSLPEAEIAGLLMRILEQAGYTHPSPVIVRVFSHIFSLNIRNFSESNSPSLLLPCIAISLQLIMIIMCFDSIVSRL